MDGDEHRRLGLTVELLHVDAERAVEVEDLGADGLARGVGHAHAAHAQRVLERSVDQEIAQRIEQPIGRRDGPAVEQRRSDPAGERHEELEHAALEEARVLHADRDLRDQVLEHARRRKVIGRADLAQVGHHRGRRFGAVHHQADDVALSIGEDVVAYPGHRQVGQQLVAFLEAIEVRAGAGGPYQVVIAQHRAFGPAGGAGGVEHDGVVRAPPLRDLGQHPVRRRCQQLGAALLHRVVGQQALVISQAARVVVDDDGERRHPLPDLEELVDLLLVLGQGETRTGMLDDVGKLVGHRILVDRHRHAAQRLRRAHRPIEPGPVVADHDQPVAAPEAEIGQARRQQANLRCDMGPVIGLPDAVFLLTVGRPVGAAAGALRQKLGKRVPSVGSGGGRPPCHPLPRAPTPRRSFVEFCGDFDRQIATVNLRWSSWRPAAGEA